MQNSIIYPDGHIEPILKERLSLTYLQDVVGGWVDIINLREGVLVFNSDCGDLLFNPKATEMLAEEYGPDEEEKKHPERWFKNLSGNVVYCMPESIVVD